LTQLVLALKVAGKRGPGIVPIWVERFALAVLAAVFVGAVIFNVLKMDWIQKMGLGMGILGLSIFLAQTLHLFNKAKADTNTSQQGEPKKPEVQQSSQGANSPNIVGNNNTINIGDPKTNAPLDKITKILKAQQGDHVSPKNLLARYPLGYTIFEVDYTNSVYPYQSHALDDWDFDWNVVTLKETKVQGGAIDMLMLRLPDIRHKGGGPSMIDATVGQPKRIGPFGGSLLRYDGVFDMKAEVLAIRDGGIVFLIGFARPAPKKPA
jgi:hypothetical protein